MEMPEGKAVMMLFRKSMVCLLTGLILIMFSCGLASAEESVLRCLILGEQYDIVISQQTAFGLQYLMLPASINYRTLCVSVSDSASLKGTVENAAIDLSGGEWSAVDMTSIFGDMVPGLTYPLRIETAKETWEVLLIQSENLSSMHILLDEKALPEDSGSALTYLQANIDNELSGWMTMIRPDGTMTSHVIQKIKGRGNTSWQRSGEKRPYNIKLDKKAELIRGDEKASKWCLISNNCMYLQNDKRISDKTGIQNSIAYQVYQDIDGASAVHFENIDLYIDSIYQGTYLLTDKVELGNSRINISKPENDTSKIEIITVDEDTTDDPAIQAGLRKYQYSLPDGAQLKSGGFLLEIDFYYGGEKTWFVTRRGVQISFKEPEYATREQVQRVAMYIQAFEDALYADSGLDADGRPYTDYIDVDSWAKQFLMGCFFGNMDIFDSSTFLYADVADKAGNYGPIFCGPAWDYDICVPQNSLFNEKIGGQHIQREYVQYNNIWAEQLLHRGDFIAELGRINSTVFRSAVISAGESLDGWISRMSATSAMNDILWHNHFIKNTEMWKNNYNDRLAFWYQDLWSDQKLKGITITLSDDGQSLICHVEGNAAGLQWYTVSEDGSLEPIPAATEPALIPPGRGMYCCAAEGQNIGYSSYAAKHLESYTLNGIASVVTQPSITMFSNIVTAGTAL